jgi:mitogen-activated protein kinase kinase kinase
VVAWLHSIKCGQYESIFRGIISLVIETNRGETDTAIANNFNGDNLIDCDQKILQEIGIKKVGDRVRIFIAIKQLRNKAMVNPRQKNIVCSFVVSHVTGMLTFGKEQTSCYGGCGPVL